MTTTTIVLMICVLLSLLLAWSYRWEAQRNAKAADHYRSQLHLAQRRVEHVAQMAAEAIRQRDEALKQSEQGPLYGTSTIWRN